MKGKDAKQKTTSRAPKARGAGAGRPKGSYSADPTAMCASLAIVVRARSGAQAKDADDAARSYFEQDARIKAYFAEMRDAAGAISRMRKRIQKGQSRQIVFGEGQVRGAMAFLHPSVPSAKFAKAEREAGKQMAANARAILAKFSTS